MESCTSSYNGMFLRREENVLERLNAAARDDLLEQAEERRISKGSLLFSQGEPHKTTYFIQSGLIKTFYISPTGKEMTLAYWTSGDMIGAPDFFDQSPHVWSASAVKESTVLAIDGKKLGVLVNRYPDLAHIALQALAFKVQWLSCLLQTISTESVTDRLAHLLLQLAEMYGTETDDGILLVQRFNQEELANMIGASRQWVNLALNRLQRARVISITKRRITLLNIETLRNRIDSDVRHSGPG